MNYRFLNTSEQDNRGVTTSFKDAENVLNFIRTHTNKLKIDSNKIFIKGNGFAGSSITQYLLSQPFYSSKVKGISMNDPLSSLDFWISMILSVTLTLICILLSLSKMSK